MITYVDTSTLIKLLVEEPGSEQARVIWTQADTVASVRLLYVEAYSALAMARRMGRLSIATARRTREELESLSEQLLIVEITDDLMRSAAALAERHALRGYDAVHLAAAILVGPDIVASADDALCAAATGCGLHVAKHTRPSRSD